MLKKIILVVTALCLLLSCTACSLFVKPVKVEDEPETKPSQKEEEETTQTPTQESEETESTTESTEELTQELALPPYELLLPAEEQISILVANRDLWYLTDDYYVPYSYTVCDLNQNGRLELLINICMGTGFFSENYIWEINESLDGVISCENPFEDYGSQVDLGYAQCNAYYDPSGAYYYIATDYFRNGWAFNATEKYALSLEEGKLSFLHLASCGCENFEDGTQIITCEDDAGTEITQEEFDNIEQTVFADLLPLTANFLWQAEYMEDTDLLDADGWHRLLEESWAGFSLEEK